MTKTCTKKDIVKEVSDRTGIDINNVRDIAQAVFDTMCEGLVEDGNIEIRNFGMFKVKQTSERMARNPKTGETIKVPPKTHVHFKPGQLMKQQINKGGATEPEAVSQPEPSVVVTPIRKTNPIRVL